MSNNNRPYLMQLYLSNSIKQRFRFGFRHRHKNSKEMTKAFNTKAIYKVLLLFATDFEDLASIRKMFELQKQQNLLRLLLIYQSSVMKAHEFGVILWWLIVGAAFGAAAFSSTIRAITRNSISNIWWRSQKWWRWRRWRHRCRQWYGGQEQQQQPLTQRFVNINLSGQR